MDRWINDFYLSTLIWDLYSISNENNSTIYCAWFQTAHISHDTRTPKQEIKVSNPTRLLSIFLILCHAIFCSLGGYDLLYTLYMPDLGSNQYMIDIPILFTLDATYLEYNLRLGEVMIGIHQIGGIDSVNFLYPVILLGSIWNLPYNGVYSTKSMNHIVNDTGVRPSFCQALWDLTIPARIKYSCGRMPSTHFQIVYFAWHMKPQIISSFVTLLQKKCGK